ncbi:hypothetical protein COJ85_13945 [Bacillus sp. AFS076308]|nr:hypothetical protein COJ85_13945 [Bacillus sp. AFS076308]
MQLTFTSKIIVHLQCLYSYKKGGVLRILHFYICFFTKKILRWAFKYFRWYNMDKAGVGETNE